MPNNASIAVLLIPVIAGLVGWFTNWLAVRMTLYPVEFKGIGAFGWQPIFDTFARIRNLQGEISDGRLSYWQDCLALWRDFPVLGSGFGSFIDSYAGYQSIFQGERVVDEVDDSFGTWFS